MGTRTIGSRIGFFGAAAVLGAALLISAPGFAQSSQSRMKACGEEWNAAKAAGKVPAGQSWQDFYKSCNARLKAQGEAAGKPAVDAKSAAKPEAKSQAKPGTPATTAAPAPDKAKAASKPGTSEGAKREQTPGQIAAHERQKECGAEWRRQKEAGKIPAGQTWPQYWSACNTRLKARDEKKGK